MLRDRDLLGEFRYSRIIQSAKVFLPVLALSATILWVNSPKRQYETNPYNPACDEIAWTALRPLMQIDATILGASVKDSHWCHWDVIPKPPKLNGIELAGDNSKRPRISILDNLGMSLGFLGWDEVDVLKPRKDTLEENFKWQLAYSGQRRGGWIYRLSLIFNQDSAVKLLVGPGNSLVYGIKEDGTEVRLSNLGRYPRFDTNIPGVQI